MRLFPANTRRCGNVVVRQQRRTINTQRCHNVDATNSKLQRWIKVVSTWDSKFNSWSCMLTHVILTTWCYINSFNSCCIDNVFATLKLWRLRNFTTVMSNSQRWINVTSRLDIDSKFISHQIMDIIKKTSIQRCNQKVKYITSQDWYLQRRDNVVSALQIT